MTNTKGKTENVSQTNVVYKVNCKKMYTVYIDQTKNHVITRVKHHKEDIAYTIPNEASVTSSYDFTNSQILEMSNVNNNLPTQKYYFLLN